jgi:hypothetical protein
MAHDFFLLRLSYVSLIVFHLLVLSPGLLG